jgi:hypothetical protein
MSSELRRSGSTISVATSRGWPKKKARLTSLVRSGELAGRALTGVTSSMTSWPPTRSRSTSEEYAMCSGRAPSANSRSNGACEPISSLASPASTLIRPSLASSRPACAALASSISNVTRVQSAGIELAIQALPTPTPVPISPIRPAWQPAASTARMRPTPGRQHDGMALSGPASSRVRANPTWRASAFA